MRTGVLERIRTAANPRELFLLRLRSVEFYRASADTRRKWEREIIRRRLDLADAAAAEATDEHGQARTEGSKT